MPVSYTHLDVYKRQAIEYHRKVRSKEVTKSLLDNIDGIGEVRKPELLKRFGSVEKILNASDDEISQINGSRNIWVNIFVHMLNNLLATLPIALEGLVGADAANIASNLLTYIVYLSLIHI